jgi:hypothetical protein
MVRCLVSAVDGHFVTVITQDASTIRANPKVIEFYQRMRSDASEMNTMSRISTASTADDDSNVLQSTTSGVLDTLKGRWSTLMATVQSNIEETLHGASAIMPFTRPSSAPRDVEASLPLSQRNANVPVDDCAVKKQKVDEKQAAAASQQSTHSCIGVAGETLVWSGCGTLTSACNCMLMLKQVIVAVAVAALKLFSAALR